MAFPTYVPASGSARSVKTANSTAAATSGDPDINISGTLPVEVSGLNLHVPTTATAATLTFTAGGAGVSHVIDGVAWSYSAAPTGGRLTVLNGAARTVTDGVTTNTSTTVTSATAAFVTADIGSTISGTGIPVGSRITAVGSATSVTISNAATASGSGLTVVITPIVLDLDITAAGPGSLFPSHPLKGSANTAMTITLASGAGSVVGKLNVLGKRTES